jgi:hypothetical protein
MDVYFRSCPRDIRVTTLIFRHSLRMLLDDRGIPRRPVSTESAIRAVDPDHLVLRPRKMRSGQRFSYLALDPEETRALNAAYHERIHRDQIQSHPA